MIGLVNIASWNFYWIYELLKIIGTVIKHVCIFLFDIVCHIAKFIWTVLTYIFTCIGDICTYTYTVILSPILSLIGSILSITCTGI